MLTLGLIFSLIVLVMSIVIHEVSHGYAAYIQGDPTAKYEDRLTLNPLKHLDPMGSVIVPIFTYLLTGLAFGWAKPVPFNPYNLKSQRWGEFWVALAGPASNLLIAAVFGLLIRLQPTFLPESFVTFSALVVIINIGLAVFNIVPIPPLDGSKILFAFLPLRFRGFREAYERFSLPLLLFFVFFLSQYLGVIAGFLFTRLTGLAF